MTGTDGQRGGRTTRNWTAQGRSRSISSPNNGVLEHHIGEKLVGLSLCQHLFGHNGSRCGYIDDAVFVQQTNAEIVPLSAAICLPPLLTQLGQNGLQVAAQPLHRWV